MTPNPEILGRLLFMQQTLNTMPDEIGIANYLCRALMQVPGVGEVRFCFRGAVLASQGGTCGQSFSVCPEDPCGHCGADLRWHHDLVCQLSSQTDKWIAAMRTPRQHYGFLVLSVSNREAIAPYQSYLSNFANIVATFFENHDLTREMREANEHLRQARDALEGKVAERTHTLMLLNQQLQSEIRERRAAEERTRSLALYVRSLIEACPDPLLVINPDGAITDVNTATEQATGRSRLDLIDQEFSACFDDPAAARALRDEVFSFGQVRARQLAITPRPRPGAGDSDQGPAPHQPPLPDEERIDVLVNAAVYPGRDGEVAGAFVIARDITDRLRAEQQLSINQRLLQTLIDTTEDTIALVDADGRILACNRAGAERFGLNPEEILGRTFATLYHDAESRHRLQAVREVLGTGHHSHHEFTWGDRVLDSSLYPVVGSDGKAWAVSIHSRDITERKAHETVLDAARAAAEQASQAKSNFLAAMSHELRTPLNAILGFSEIIQHEMLGPVGMRKYVEYAADINASGQHLLALISDILDISKIEAGRMEIETTRVDVGTLIGATVRLVGERAANQGLRLETSLAPELPPLHADKRAVKQILFNLVSNAIKFTPRGGVVSLSAHPGSGGGVDLRVTDTGIGIPPDQIDRILQPFERIDNRYNRAGGGTGLGLALVKGLIDLHHGRLGIESRLGRGTEVSVWFPPDARDAA